MPGVYGESLHLMRIDALSDTEFRETHVQTLSPSHERLAWHAQRIHHADVRLLPAAALQRLWAAIREGANSAAGSAAGSPAAAAVAAGADRPVPFATLSQHGALVAPPCTTDSGGASADHPADRSRSDGAAQLHSGAVDVASAMDGPHCQRAGSSAGLLPAEALFGDPGSIAAGAAGAAARGDGGATASSAAMVDASISGATGAAGSEGGGVWVGLVDGDMYTGGRHHFNAREGKFVAFKRFLLHLAALQLLVVCLLHAALPSLRSAVVRQPGMQAVAAAQAAAATAAQRCCYAWRAHGALAVAAAAAVTLTLAAVALAPAALPCPRWPVSVRVPDDAWDRGARADWEHAFAQGLGNDGAGALVHSHSPHSAHGFSATSGLGAGGHTALADHASRGHSHHAGSAHGSSEHSSAKAGAHGSDAPGSANPARHGNAVHSLKDLVVATGATVGFFDRLENLVGSIHVWAPSQKVLVFDMGLNSNQLAAARCWRNVQTARFPFELFPEHVADMQTYAFKALAIQLALQRHGAVLWLDAGLEVRFACF